TGLPEVDGVGRLVDGVRRRVDGEPRVEPYREHVAARPHRVDDLEGEREITAEVLAELVAVQGHRGTGECGTEVDERPVAGEVGGQVEVPAVDPHLLPRRRVPVTPGQLGDRVRQRDADEVAVVVVRCLRAVDVLAAEQPVLVERDDVPLRPCGHADSTFKARQASWNASLTSGSLRSTASARWIRCNREVTVLRWTSSCSAVVVTELPQSRYVASVPSSASSSAIGASADSANTRAFVERRSPPGRRCTPSAAAAGAAPVRWSARSATSRASSRDRSRPSAPALARPMPTRAGRSSLSARVHGRSRLANRCNASGVGVSSVVTQPAQPESCSITPVPTPAVTSAAAIRSL